MVVKRYTNSGTGNISLSNMTGGYEASSVVSQHEIMPVPFDYELINNDPSGSHTALINLASLGINGIKITAISDFEVWIGVSDVHKIPPINEKYEANVGYTKIYILGDEAKVNSCKLVFCLKDTNTTKTKLPISDVTSIERYSGWTNYVGQICDSATDTLSFTTVSGLSVNVSQLKTVASSGATMYYIPYYDTYNGSNYTNRSYLIFKIPTTGGALGFYRYPYNVFQANKDVTAHPVEDTWLEDGYRYYKLNFGAYSGFSNIIVTGNADQIVEITREKLLWDNYNPYIYAATDSEWVNNPYYDKIYGYKYDTYGNRLSYYYYYRATDVAKCWMVEPGITYRLKIKGQDNQAYSKFNIVLSEKYEGSGAVQLPSLTSMSYDSTEDVMYTDITVGSGMHFLWITNASGYFDWLNGIADDITIGVRQEIPLATGALTNGYLRYNTTYWSIQTYSNKGSLKYLTIPAGTPKKFKLTTVGLPYVYWNYSGISVGQQCYDAPSPISTTQNGNTYIREYDLTSFIGNEYTVNIILTADHVQSSVGATNYNNTYSGTA